MISRNENAVIHWVCLLSVGVIVMTVQLGNTHLWDQDEGYYAATAAEMFQRNDWITPTFNKLLFAHKPPMMYWGMMAGYHFFGVSELGARFVSSLFGIGTILLTYRIARRLFDATTGLFSGLAIGSCIMFTMVARSATADAHLTFFVALSLMLWLDGYFSSQQDSRDTRLRSMTWKVWASVYAVMGLAVLTKGPIGFLFPMAIIGLFLLTEKHSEFNAETLSTRKSWLRNGLRAYSPVPFLMTVWKMRPMTAAFVVLAVSAPWYAIVQWKTDGAFLREFIGVHHMGRFAGAMDNHSGPLYYYIITCLIGLYPWSAFAIPTLLSWIRPPQHPNESRSIRLISCWAAVYLVIFSLASTKLPNYILPAYPALAIMIGRYFALWMTDVQNVNVRWLHAGWMLLVLFGAAISILFPLAGLVTFNGQTLFDRVSISTVDQQHFVWFGIVGLPLLLLGGIGWLLLCRKQAKSASALFALTAVSMVFILCQFIAPEMDRFQKLQATAYELRQQSSAPASTVVALGCFRPSLVFYFHREILFCDSQDQALHLLGEDPNCILVTTAEQYEQIQAKIPAGKQLVQRLAQFPNQGELVVLTDGSLIR